ncbi:uncharacterized protein C8R40DRAFT_1110831 [Lentinula edodes]|uniref:uncharacterized protein n=1 Tax=Lentinula edodes TaxID=5353 RepID=UPI001E8D767B|nr:uncharacterized protein C8R40DRAFT_1110831 [Lentinula edodes]KAH7874018.1 hypothetical protein C8R40DRAFT_1110831 [Lentinula edodes]
MQPVGLGPGMIALFSSYFPCHASSTRYMPFKVPFQGLQNIVLDLHAFFQPYILLTLCSWMIDGSHQCSLEV